MLSPWEVRRGPGAFAGGGGFFFVAGKPVSLHAADGGPMLTAFLAGLCGKPWLVSPWAGLWVDVHRTLSQIQTPQPIKEPKLGHSLTWEGGLLCLCL